MALGSWLTFKLLPDYHMNPRQLGQLCALLISAAITSAVANESGRLGQFLLLGTTEACCDWKVAHPADQRLLYRLNSATGTIEVCGDVEGFCRAVPGSDRDAKGILIGRFAGLRLSPPTPGWKATHPEDDYLIYSIDTFTGQIVVCGNVKGDCSVLAKPTLAINHSPQVVMLYRRADSAAIAGRIYDRLVAHYGGDAVFMDVYSIPLAVDWRENVKRMSLDGGAIVVVVGSSWLGRLPDGHIRINDIDDPVRTELELAMAAQVPIFPVLVEGASMPPAIELPDTLKQFSNINAATVASGRDFDQHMTQLIEALDRRLAKHETSRGAQ
jgi:hypothetical protein